MISVGIRVTFGLTSVLGYFDWRSDSEIKSKSNIKVIYLDEYPTLLAIHK